MRKNYEHLKLLSSPFGCQLWVEPDDSPERLQRLMNCAVESGLSRLRIFLLWTRIEHRPGEFDFAVYDRVFAAAAATGLGIKATLTANSGPWHVETPAALHSHTGFLVEAHREAMRRYVRECVTRYAAHPALAQWVLWNEPHGGCKDHVDDNLPGWRAWLSKNYRGQIGTLNREWLTGFASFQEVDWPENLSHPSHRDGSWTPYAPALAEMEWRAQRLVEQVGWVAREVRKHDQKTELCINPIFTIENKAGGATDLAGLAAQVDRLGSSYHPVFWHEHLDREDYPAMIGAGVSALVQMGGGKPVELTEVMSGNCFQTGSRPVAVGAAEIVRFYLAALASGAESVTGWCLNPRPQNGEAGEFALLDDNEEVSARGRHLARLAEVIEETKREAGPWRPPVPEVAVAVDRRSQALDFLDSQASTENPPRPGRGAQDAGRAAWLMAARATAAGYSTVVVEPRSGGGYPADCGKVLIASHLRAWNRPQAMSLLSHVRRGGTLIFDALAGRKFYDSSVHRPWPGFLAEKTGLRVLELHEGSPGFPLFLDGREAALAATFRTEIVADAHWRTWSWCRFSDDQSPALLERKYGQGRLIYARFAIGPSLLANRHQDGWFLRILAELAGSPGGPVRLLPGCMGGLSMRVPCESGDLTVVLAPERNLRTPSVLRFASHPGTKWKDFWTRTTIQADGQGEFVLPCEEGVAILREVQL